VLNAGLMLRPWEVSEFDLEIHMAVNPGLGRIAVSDIELPNMLANLV
jgi:hypothetical protein